MKTVGEMSRITGVSIRTMRYYDEKGLLKPTRMTEAGYRLYDESALKRLGQIMLLRELDFPLKDIGAMLDGETPQGEAVKAQIRLLEMRRDRLDALIEFARTIEQRGGTDMDFSAFDKTQIDAYAKEARARWGETEAYREYEQKHGERGTMEEKTVGDGLMTIFAEFGRMLALDPTSEKALIQAGKLNAYISKNYYTCTKTIFRSLADVYEAGGEMTENIDRCGGRGTAAFAARAIRAWCER